MSGTRLAALVAAWMLLNCLVVVLLLRRRDPVRTLNGYLLAAVVVAGSLAGAWLVHLVP